MIVVTGGRQTGKTEAVVRWLAENPGHRAIVVGDFDRANYIIKRLRERFPNYFHWKEHVIIASGDYIFNSRPQFQRFHQVAIDDADYVLAKVLGAQVDFMTVNATWIPLSPNNDPVKVDVIQDKEIEASVMEIES